MCFISGAGFGSNSVFSNLPVSQQTPGREVAFAKLQSSFGGIAGKIGRRKIEVNRPELFKRLVASEKSSSTSGSATAQKKAVAKTSSKPKTTLLTSTSGLAKKTLLGT